MKKIRLGAILMCSASLSFVSVPGLKAMDVMEGCSAYPYVAMQTKFEAQGNGSFKLLTTQEASVRANSQSMKVRALKIAQLRGEQAVSKFIQQEIEGKDSFSNEFVEESVMNPEGVDWNNKEVINQLETISTSSKNVIRGIIPLGSCYEPGKYVLVTVGIKPETIQAAGNADATGKKPFSGYESTSSNPANPSVPSGGDEAVNATPASRMQPFNTAPGFSGINTDF